MGIVKDINVAIENSEIASNGLRKFSVRMVNSDHPQLAMNELTSIMQGIKHSRYNSRLVYTLDFAEPDYPYDCDDFHGTLTLICKYGKDDITAALRQGDITWTRYSEDVHGNVRTASDAIWNIAHDVTHWPTGRTQLTLQQSDIDGEVEFPAVVKFTATVKIRDGKGSVIGDADITAQGQFGDEYMHFDYIN